MIIPSSPQKQSESIRKNYLLQVLCPFLVIVFILFTASPTYAIEFVPESSPESSVAITETPADTDEDSLSFLDAITISELAYLAEPENSCESTDIPEERTEMKPVFETLSNQTSQESEQSSAEVTASLPETESEPANDSSPESPGESPEQITSSEIPGSDTPQVSIDSDTSEAQKRPFYSYNFSKTDKAFKDSDSNLLAEKRPLFSHNYTDTGEAFKDSGINLLAQKLNPEGELPPRKPVHVRMGVWDEGGTNRYDYSMYVTVIRYDKMQVRYDFFNRDNFKRLWFNYGNFPVVKGENFTLNVNPGIAVNSKKNFHYGADITANFPKLGLSVLQRSYAGSLSSYHQTWSNLRVHKNATIQWYRFTREKYSPDSYLGPKINVGPIEAYYGWSTTRKGARAFSIFGSFKF